MAKANLGILLSDLRGKAGNAVFSNTKEGTVVRMWVSTPNPNTPAQQTARANLGKASVAYRGMTSGQVTAWHNYALTHPKTDPVTGKSTSPNANNVFTKLASKFLQVNPTGTIPLTPPTSSFSGDSITLSTTVSSSSITFTASAANSTNVKTELLLQPVASANRKPGKNNYRSKAFYAFAAGSLSTTINLSSGYYSPAYRFVNTLTGQATELKVLTTVQVGTVTVNTSTEKLKKAA